MSTFDVLTIGNAIVDIIARCEDRFLDDNEIIKSAMNLIDAERAELLYSRMGRRSRPPAAAPAIRRPALPASAAGRLFRQVASDQLGEIFTHDIRAQGVHFRPGRSEASRRPPVR